MPEAERLALARYTVETIRKVLKQGMAAAPQVLFVGAAGNAGSSMQAANPATLFSLPNFVLVGGVDRNGAAVDWTNTGPEITLFANGDRIPARMPGGDLSYPTGTSMAVPVVVNAAAKVLAANPAMSGAELRQILEQTATPNAAGQRLLHPAKAFERVAEEADGLHAMTICDWIYRRKLKPGCRTIAPESNSASSTSPDSRTPTIRRTI
jgi:hypothetical protein